MAGLFILLGIAGLILPAMPGWIFIALAVLLLADDVPVFRRLIQTIETRLPVARGVLHRARGWLGRRPARP